MIRSNWTKINFIYDIITMEHLLKHTLFIDFIALEVSFFFSRSFYNLCLILFCICACMGSYVSTGLFTFFVPVFVGVRFVSSVFLVHSTVTTFFQAWNHSWKMGLSLTYQKELGNLFSLTSRAGTINLFF